MPQRVDARIELKPAQRAALAALEEGRLDELTRSAYEELTGMSRSQAAYDLADLVEAGILERVGGGRSTRYLLTADAPGRRRWTSERIRSELTRFCGNRQTWPSAAEFKSSGRSDLYVAASRYGGIAYWAGELGFPKQAPPPRRPRRLGWALAGAAAGAVAVAGAFAIVQQRQSSATQPPLATAAPRPKPADLGAHAATHNRAVRGMSTRTRRAARAHVSAPRSTTKPRPAAPRVTAASTSARELAARTVTSTPRTAVTSAPTHAGAGPAPLPAPSSSSSGPAPLAAPG